MCKLLTDICGFDARRHRSADAHVTWKQKSSRAAFKATCIRGRNTNGQFSSVVYPGGSESLCTAGNQNLVEWLLVVPQDIRLVFVFNVGQERPRLTQLRECTHAVQTTSERGLIDQSSEAAAMLVFTAVVRGEHVCRITQDGKQLHLNLNS